MAATIQHIELPKKPRALDSSTSIQEVSQELITNGDLSSAGTVDATSWSLGWSSDTANVTIAGSKLVLTRSIGAYSTAHPTDGASSRVIMVSGNTYSFTYTVSANDDGSNTVANFLYNDGTNDHSAPVTVDTHTVTFTATGTHFGISNTSSNSILKLDDLSLKQVENFSNNNHGQIYSGRGLEFDGVGDYLTTNYGNGLNVSTTPITIALWVKPVGTTEIFFSGGSSSTARLYLAAVSGAFDLGIATSPWLSTINEVAGFSDQPSFNVNTWYRIVVVLDGSQATMYVNGVKSYAKSYDPYTLSMDFVMGTLSTSNTSYFFDGALSDVQVWEAAWSADDIAYDYANPESLALNASGTALTEANLKLWYPMQDGHRGQQSYILDGANTGLNTSGAITPNLSDNGDFDGAGDSNWDLDTSAEWTVNTNTSTSFEATADSDISGTAYMAFYLSGDNTGISANLPAGSYKLTGTLSTTSTLPSTQCKIRWFDTGGASQDTNLSEGDFEVITLVSSASGNSHFRFEASAEGQNFTLSNVKITPINDKHHATTVFLGDELITNGTFESDITGWTNSNGTNMVRHTSTPISGNGDLQWGQSSTSAGYTGFRQTNSTAITAGRTYVLAYTYRVVGTPDIFAKLGNGTSMTSSLLTGFTETALNATSNTSVSYTFTAGASGDYYLMFRTAENADAAIFVDDISLKEVGVASGWTDADQQLDIAQPALQSYNEMAWFDGTTAGKVTCGSGATIDNVFAGGGTFSGWVYPVHSTASQARRIAEKSKWLVYYHDETSTEAYVSFKHVAATDSITRTLTKDLKIGKWNHVAATFNKDSIDTAAVVYINGVSVATDLTAGAGTAGDDSGDVMYIANNNTGNRGLHGSITEVSLYEEVLTAAEILELYNEGKALDATTHSQADELKAYWRNNGLSTWTDLSTNSNDGAVSGVTETLLIPQGVDGSRDTQGFIMNRARNTSSLNLTNAGREDGYVDLGSTTIVADDADATFIVWLKPDDTATDNYFLGTGSTDFIKLDSSTTIQINVGGTVHAFTVPTIVAKEWVHVAITRTAGDDKFRLLVNGSSSGIGASNAINKAFDFRYVGARNHAEYTFRGQLDGFLYYDDKLDDTEVLRNYKATKGSHRN